MSILLMPSNKNGDSINNNGGYNFDNGYFWDSSRYLPILNSTMKLASLKTIQNVPRIPKSRLMLKLTFEK